MGKWVGVGEKGTLQALVVVNAIFMQIGKLGAFPRLDP